MKIKLSDLLSGFAYWLNRSHYYKVGDNLKKFKSGLAYANYMMYAISDLGIDPATFEKYSQPGLLKSFLKSLKNTGIFKQRDKKIQSDIISAFNAYIKYRVAVSK